MRAFLAATLFGAALLTVHAATLEDTVVLTLNSTRYCVGTPWHLTASNAAPNATIRLSGTVNGIPWEIRDWATTDVSGTFAASGTYTADTVARYTLRAEVAGVASNTLSLEVVNCRARVLLLSTGSSATDTQIRTALQNHGHVVTIGRPYFAFNGEDLQNQDVVLLLPNENWTAGDMPSSGQDGLLQFVTTGGGLVTGEWTVWKWGASGEFASLSRIFPVGRTTDYSDNTFITYTEVTPDPLINTAVPFSFGFTSDFFDGAESVLTPYLTATVFYRSSIGVGLVGWRAGAGHVLQFSTTVGPIALGDSRYGRLVANAVSWAAQENWEPLVTEMRFDSETVAVGNTRTATFLGFGLLQDTYFDVRFREPGSATNQVSFNWQRGTTAQHTIAQGVRTGTWIVTGVRAHRERDLHLGDFDPVQAVLNVTP